MIVRIYTYIYTYIHIYAKIKQKELLHIITNKKNSINYVLAYFHQRHWWVFSFTFLDNFLQEVVQVRVLVPLLLQQCILAFERLDFFL